MCSAPTLIAGVLVLTWLARPSYSCARRTLQVLRLTYMQHFFTAGVKAENDAAPGGDLQQGGAPLPSACARKRMRQRVAQCCLTPISASDYMLRRFYVLCWHVLVHWPHISATSPPYPPPSYMPMWLPPSPSAPSSSPAAAVDEALPGASCCSCCCHNHQEQHQQQPCTKTTTSSIKRHRCRYLPRLQPEPRCHQEGGFGLVGGTCSSVLGTKPSWCHRTPPVGTRGTTPVTPGVTSDGGTTLTTGAGCWQQQYG